MEQRVVFVLVCFLVLSGTFIIIDNAGAQEDPFANLAYPIAELGACADRTKCEIFCQAAENRGVCLDFAEKQNLLPQEDIEMGRKMLAAGKTEGPGGCLGEECKAYCDEIAHIKECIAFAKENGLLPQEEIAEAEKVIAAIDQGLTPPPCKGKDECDAYCSDVEHMEECITFGEAAGLIPPDELEGAKKMLLAIRAGATPPPCKGKDECDVYCQTPDHMAQCIEFAIAAGFMPAEEAAQAQKMLEVIKTGIKPPNCKGESECQAYCQEEAHFAECVDFAVAMGDMTPEEAEKAKLTGGKGPGGCANEQECQAFCQNPENSRACLEFAVKTGELSPEEMERMLEGNQQGVGEPGQQIMQAGPGGCQSPDECMKYCSDPANQQECANFGGGQAGPNTGPIQGPNEGPIPQDSQGLYGPPPQDGEGGYPMPPQGYTPGEGQQYPPIPPGGYVPQEGQQYPIPPEGYVQPQNGGGYAPSYPEGQNIQYPQGYTPQEGQYAPQEGGYMYPQNGSGGSGEGDYTIPSGGGGAPSGNEAPAPPPESAPAPSPESAPAPPPSEPQSFLWPLQLFLSNILIGLGL